jgi:uncharacterized protein YegL
MSAHQNIIFIVDNSLSTEYYSKEYTNAINGIILYQKNINPNSSLSLITFNDNINYIYVNTNINYVDNIDVKKLKPSGCTAFYDNFVDIINTLKKFNNFCSPPMVIILTDGEDNCSKKVNEHQVWVQVNIAKSHGWKFVYLGTSENSVKIGRNIGCNACILYETTEKSFTEIINVVGRLLNDKVKDDIDIDIRDLTNSMNDIKIVF